VYASSLVAGLVTWGVLACRGQRVFAIGQLADIRWWVLLT